MKVAKSQTTILALKKIKKYLVPKKIIVGKLVKKL